MGTINEVATFLRKAWNAAVRNDELAERGLKQSGLVETALCSAASGVPSLVTLHPATAILTPIITFALATGGLRLLNEYRLENASQKPAVREKNTQVRNG